VQVENLFCLWSFQSPILKQFVPNVKVPPKVPSKKVTVHVQKKEKNLTPFQGLGNFSCERLQICYWQIIICIFHLILHNDEFKKP
jgi:hypothetical protein